MSFRVTNSLLLDPKPNFYQLYEYNKVFQDIPAPIFDWTVDSDGVYGIQYFLKNKVECVLTMVIWSEFRMGQYRDDDHREDAPHFCC